MSKNDFKIAVFDIETTPIKVDVFRLGKQVLRQNQLDPAYSTYDIISISYIDNVSRECKILHWGYGSQTSEEMLEQFDKIIKDYEENGFVIFGKNNNKFDNKHLNTMRWLQQREPLPYWTKYVDDIEKLMRKNFALASYALDYTSRIMKLGGKERMLFDDWQYIVRAKKIRQALDTATKLGISRYAVKALTETFMQVDLDETLRKGKEALNKMLEYNKKDSVDTLLLVESMLPYVSGFKSNVASTNTLLIDNSGALHCKNCGSSKLRKAGRVGNHQQFVCLDCPLTPGGNYSYAGRCLITQVGKYGKIKD